MLPSTLALHQFLPFAFLTKRFVSVVVHVYIELVVIKYRYTDMYAKKNASLFLKCSGPIYGIMLSTLRFFLFNIQFF